MTSSLNHTSTILYYCWKLMLSYSHISPFSSPPRFCLSSYLRPLLSLDKGDNSITIALLWGQPLTNTLGCILYVQTKWSVLSWCTRYLSSVRYTFIKGKQRLQSAVIYIWQYGSVSGPPCPTMLIQRKLESSGKTAWQKISDNRLEWLKWHWLTQIQRERRRCTRGGLQSSLQTCSNLGQAKTV